jgi:hypothetical protein
MSIITVQTSRGNTKSVNYEQVAHHLWSAVKKQTYGSGGMPTEHKQKTNDVNEYISYERRAIAGVAIGCAACLLPAPSSACISGESGRSFLNCVHCSCILIGAVDCVDVCDVVGVSCDVSVVRVFAAAKRDGVGVLDARSVVMEGGEEETSCIESVHSQILSTKREV